MKKIAFCFIILVLISCSNVEKQAQGIYDEAQSLEKQGEILKALAMYELLAPFEETEIYKKAEAELLQKGYSLKSARSSWTIQKQIDIENIIMKQYEAFKTFPEIEKLGDLTDAWSNKMTLEYQPTNQHLFKIRSFGPDGIANTSDDLLLSYRDKYKFEASDDASSNTKSEITIGLDELSKLNRTQDEEIQVDLNELKKVDNDEHDLSEQAMDLDELLKKKK